MTYLKSVPSPCFNTTSKKHIMRKFIMCQNPYTQNTLCFSHITRLVSCLKEKYVCSDISCYLNISAHANFQWSLSLISFCKCSNQWFPNGSVAIDQSVCLFVCFSIADLSWTETFVKYNNNDFLEKRNNIKSKTQNVNAFLMILILKCFRSIRFLRRKIPWKNVYMFFNASSLSVLMTWSSNCLQTSPWPGATFGPSPQQQSLQYSPGL